MKPGTTKVKVDVCARHKWVPQGINGLREETYLPWSISVYISKTAT